MDALWHVAEWTWNRLPDSLMRARPARACGDVLHAVVRRQRRRRQYYGTFFLRNRPQLELIRRLADRTGAACTLRIAVLGCSNGAEVYSILATMRSARPDRNVIVQAVDISEQVLALAREGAYSLNAAELVGAPIFQPMTDAEIERLFVKEGDTLRIGAWIKEGITWHLGDAGDPKLLSVLGRQHIVVANNFLCHMIPSEAETCLRRIARLVEPAGYLVVSGIDLDVRESGGRDLKWTPVRELLEDVHDGDPVVRRDWPWSYWGLEPLDKSRSDWLMRYATAFQLGEAT